MIRNFVDGDIVTHGEHFATGKEATRQGIIRRLRLFLGEYFLNAAEGTPWFQSILGKTQVDIASASIKQRILTAPGVIGLTRFEFNIDQKTRKITVYASLVDINNEQFELLFDEEIIWWLRLTKMVQQGRQALLQILCCSSSETADHGKEKSCS